MFALSLNFHITQCSVSIPLVQYKTYELFFKLCMHYNDQKLVLFSSSPTELGILAQGLALGLVILGGKALKMLELQLKAV